MSDISDKKTVPNTVEIKFTPDTVVTEDELLNYLRSDFGVNPVAIVQLDPITVKSREWRFTIRESKSREDSMWATANTRIKIGLTEEGILAAEVVNTMEVETAMAALATAAVNGIPVWRIFSSKLTPEDMKLAATATDPFNPPDDLKYKAAGFWLEELRKMDAELVEHIWNNHKVKFSSETEYVQIEFSGFPFKCEDCNYIFKIHRKDIESFREKILKDGNIFCPKCGKVSLPPKGEEVSNPQSPLGQLFGKEYKATKS